MSEPYDDNDDYYEDNYDDSHDYDQNQSDWNKFYFKFDVSHSPLSEWVKKMIDEFVNEQTSLPEMPIVSFPVNGWFSNTESGGNSLLYLGNNHYNEPVYKKHHFVNNTLKQQYVLHLQDHAKHFVQQPNYYRSMFDILN